MRAVVCVCVCEAHVNTSIINTYLHSLTHSLNMAETCFYFYHNIAQAPSLGFYTDYTARITIRTEMWCNNRSNTYGLMGLLGNCCHLWIALHRWGCVYVSLSLINFNVTARDWTGWSGGGGGSATYWMCRQSLFTFTGAQMSGWAPAQTADKYANMWHDGTIM